MISLIIFCQPLLPKNTIIFHDRPNLEFTNEKKIVYVAEFSSQTYAYLQLKYLTIRNNNNSNNNL